MNILDLSHDSAKEFLLSGKSYTNLDLPKYFDFETVIADVDSHMKGRVLSYEEVSPAKLKESVNYTIFGNKDNKFAWRKFELLNPAIYVSLVNLITEENNWYIIKNRFTELQSFDRISCLSIPVISESHQSQKATQISEWVEDFEKESIRLSLDFEYMVSVDISNCYGSIYTHTISWALHSKETAKVNRHYDDLIGNKIDHHIQAMSNGQTNGIPTGSVLMDFVAEILLAYADNNLGCALRDQSDEYQILRYRDDYRIFTRNQKIGEEIIKKLTFVLRDLGLCINSQKTCINDDLVIKSIKPDKWHSIARPTSEAASARNFLNELLTVYEIAKLYPNSGSVQTRLTHLYDKYSLEENDQFISESKEAVSVLVNIAISCPRAISIVAALISKTIKLMEISEKRDVITRVIRKLRLLPNSGFFEIWMQRIAHPNSITDIDYQEVLCQKYSNCDISLFDCSWIADENLKEMIMNADYVLLPVLNSMDREIGVEEVDLFREEYL